MAMEYDRRLMLRVILLIINAVSYTLAATKRAPVLTDDMPDTMRQALIDIHAQEVDFMRQRAEDNIGAARVTFARILNQAGKTLAQLEKD